MSKTKLTGAASPTFDWTRSHLITKAGVLAKRANQRIREIREQKLTGASNAYQYLKAREYDKVPWLSKIGSGKYEGEFKFNTNFRKMTEEDIKKELRQIEGFLKAKTSYTKGVRERIEKLTDKFNEYSGLEVSEEEFSEQIMLADVQDLFKQFNPSDIQTLLGEDKEYALHANEIVEAVARKANQLKIDRDSIDWDTIEEAFHAWGRSSAAERESESFVDFMS